MGPLQDGTLKTQKAPQSPKAGDEAEELGSCLASEARASMSDADAFEIPRIYRKL